MEDKKENGIEEDGIYEVTIYDAKDGKGAFGYFNEEEGTSIDLIVDNEQLSVLTNIVMENGYTIEIRRKD